MNRTGCIIVALALALGGAVCFVPPEYVDSAVEWSGLYRATQPIQAIIVEETALRPGLPLDTIKAIDSPDVAKYMADKSYPPVLDIDKDVKPPKGKTLPANVTAALKACDGKPLPRLIIGGKSGAMLYNDTAALANEAAELQTLQKFGGKP